jgi:hypothetical protein
LRTGYVAVDTFLHGGVTQGPELDDSAVAVGEHVGAAENARWKSKPSRASCSIRGVGTGAPYALTFRPVSCVCM